MIEIFSSIIGFTPPPYKALILDLGKMSQKLLTPLITPPRESGHFLFLYYLYYRIIITIIIN